MRGETATFRAVRGILYQFATFQDLALLLEAGGDERDLEMPANASSLRDGDWVLATIQIGDEGTSVAACVCDRGNEVRLAFEERDWQRLWQFANMKGPPSVPPPGLASEHGPVQAPPDTTVLVIDDDPETRGVLQAMLEGAGHGVVCCSSAEAAFDVLRDQTIDMVVLDRSLPGMDGLEFCRRVRKDPKLIGLPLLCLSAHSSSEDLVAAFEAGADDYVAKPFRQLELSARVIGLLRRARLPARPH